MIKDEWESKQMSNILLNEWLQNIKWSWKISKRLDTSTFVTYLHGASLAHEGGKLRLYLRCPALDLLFAYILEEGSQVRARAIPFEPQNCVAWKKTQMDIQNYRHIIKYILLYEGYSHHKFINTNKIEGIVPLQWLSLKPASSRSAGPPRLGHPGPALFVLAQIVPRQPKPAIFSRDDDIKMKGGNDTMKLSKIF